MHQKDFTGCHIPIITPFMDDCSIDEGGLIKLVNYLIEEERVDGIVPCGTTGESPTLSHKEHNQIIEIVVKEVNGRVPVIAGTGSNSTQEAINMTKHAEDVGADASLQVGPYYNRPTQDGLMRHFEAVAKNTKIPHFIYNVPTRTGRNIEPQTIIELSKIDNIIGLKDANGNLMQTMEIIRATKNSPKKFFVLSGEDALTYPMMCLGGDGVICAVGNVIGKEYTEMCKLIKAGEYEKARKIHYRTLPLVNALFIESNPAPVKEALSMMGLPAGRLRLPLVELQPENREKLRKALKEMGKL
ncbi:MAG: 4-hydroxy-tetrahydrodipicolinate synthase [Deltaproteobacteria bacterium]|jgi:4-hydroxy-tetrahydrodipicolinate synthase|nr:MAG: 4-hydroxy-tetrahydrodipicolinate synthase [Deltaproteobacteria bacterium]